MPGATRRGWPHAEITNRVEDNLLIRLPRVATMLRPSERGLTSRRRSSSTKAGGGASPSGTSCPVVELRKNALQIPQLPAGDKNQFATSNLGLDLGAQLRR